MTTITYSGPMKGSAAFPIINRHMVAGLRQRGYQVEQNLHMIDGELTDVLITCEYPPREPIVRHRLNICIATWEFSGPRSTPASFLHAFAEYDLVWAMCNHAALSFIESGVPQKKVVVGRLGVERDGTTGAGPFGEMVEDRFPSDAVVMLMVGGSDRRHGLDLASAALARLPENYYLIWKPTPGYSVPVDMLIGPRIWTVKTDWPSLAPLYRAADLFLYPVRAVAPGLPMMEALAYGLPVVSTLMTATEDIGTVPEAIQPYVSLVPGECRSMVHHIHQDCLPQWWEPDPQLIARTVEDMPKERIPDAIASQYAWFWNWDNAVEKMVATLEEAGF